MRPDSVIIPSCVRTYRVIINELGAAGSPEGPGLPLVTGSTLHSNVGDGSFALAFHSIWKEFHPSSPFSEHNARPVWQITGSADIPLARIQCCLCGPAGICTANLLRQQIFIFVDDASNRLRARSAAFQLPCYADGQTHWWRWG